MKKILLVISLAFLAFSCSDILDVEPSDTLSKDRFDEIANENPDKVFNSLVQGMYARIASFDVQPTSSSDHNHFGQKGFDYLFGLMGNDLASDGAYSMSWYDYILDYRGANYVRTRQYWELYYRTIADANTILSTADSESTNATVQGYRATALALRGYAYYYLANIYQYAYSETTKNKLSVPINTEENIGVDQPRATLDQVYTQLISDLTAAQEIFTQIGKVKAAPSDVDATVCAAYLARAYLEKKEYDKAIAQADLIISNYTLLQGRDQLWQGFSSLDLPSVIWGYKITQDNTTVYRSYFSQMDTYGAGYAAIGIARLGFKPLIDRISDTDDRLFWWSTKRASQLLYGTDEPMLRDTPYTMAEWGYDMEYVTCKFIGAGRPAILADPTLNEGKGATGWNLGSYIYLRAEEAHLIKAEALAQKGALGEATTVLENFVRTRDANYTCTATSQADLIDEIIFHKRVEFWGEGLEYLDNRRLNIPIDRTVAGSNHFGSAQFILEQSDLRFLYQLPNSEVEANKEIGYANQNE